MKKKAPLRGKAFPLASTAPQFRPTPFSGAKPRTLLLLPIAAATLLLATSCPVTVDFSEYDGTNLIPGSGFEATAPTPAWAADSPDADPYMNFTRVDLAGFGGYADAATLRNGLPAASAAAAIYRLEAKNLIANGDFEAGGTLFTAPAGGTVSITNDASTASSGALTSAFDLNNNFLFIHTASNQFLDLDLATVIAAFSPPVTDQLNMYSLSFRYYISGSNTFYLGRSDGSNKEVFRSINNTPPALYRFPYIDASGAVGGGFFNASDDFTHFQINPVGIDSAKEKIIVGTLDDLQIVRSDLDLAVRLKVPWTSAFRPPLQAGGTYTIKVLVRKDLSAGTANRFEAEYFCIGLSSDVASAYPHPGQANTFARSSAAAWDNWTELSASFASPLYSSADSGDALVLMLSALDMRGNLRSAGSILVANPRLYWTSQ